MMALCRMILHCPRSQWLPIALLACASTGCGRVPESVPTTTTRAPLTSAEVITPRPSPVTEPPYFFAQLAERVKVAEPEALRPTHMVMTADLEAVGSELDTSIHFRPERSLFRGEAGHFEVQFFHPGWSFRELVDVDVLNPDGEVQPFPFSTHLFDYTRSQRPLSGAGLGFSGFRVLSALNDPDRRDEVIVFQGASYFRSLGRGQVYGLSARALAVNLGEEKGEEFPAFSQFYLQRPSAQDQHLWLYAVLGGAAARGAYAFLVQPGETTTVEVFAKVFTTEKGDNKIGLAPMSSMFLFGEQNPAAFGDYRPEVHDSDGMAFLSQTGEHLFRPLRNPARTTHSAFRLDSPKGFGLLQRDREFAHYQDLSFQYQHRPSLWVEPLGDWGPGSLHLLEITTKLETDDNIALAWVPDAVPAAGLSLHYRLHFGRGPAVMERGGKVMATRMGRASDDSSRFVVDFAGATLPEVPVESLHATVDCKGGHLVRPPEVVELPSVGVQIRFDVIPDSTDVELRAYLRGDEGALSETWSYLWQPTP